jgi:pimeloyl-ACP methyl ester carboxylesterase
VIATRHEMRGLAEAIVQSRFVEISGAGHMAPLENPEETNAAMLAFLDELRGFAPATGS